MTQLAGKDPSIPFGQLSKVGSLLGSFFIRVPYYIGDPKNGP